MATDFNLGKVRHYLAQLYLNEEELGATVNCVAEMMKDICSRISRGQEITKCSTWHRAQQCGRIMLYYEKHFNRERLRKICPEEIASIADLGLHFYRHSPQLLISWQELELFLSAEVDRQAPLEKFSWQELPKSLWIELTGQPSVNIARWLNRTVGILLTHIPLSEADRKKTLMAVQSLPHCEYARDMLIALCEHEKECIAYSAIAAQRESSGYRFVPTLFGHEPTGTIEDTLQLHREITERNKRRDVERATVKICLCLLLALANGSIKISL